MKTLKVKSILFSLMAIMTVSVFMTSCEQTEVIENEIERVALQTPLHNYTAPESAETPVLMVSEEAGLELRGCYTAAENLYLTAVANYNANPTNYNMYLRNHHYVNYLITYVHCCTDPVCASILDAAYYVYLEQHASDAIHNPPCDYADLILDLYNQLYTICSC